MTDATKTPHADRGDTSAFTVWLGRTLRLQHEGAVHEPLPIELLAILPPPDTER